MPRGKIDQSHQLVSPLTVTLHPQLGVVVAVATPPWVFNVECLAHLYLLILFLKLLLQISLLHARLSAQQLLPCIQMQLAIKSQHLRHFALLRLYMSKFAAVKCDGGCREGKRTLCFFLLGTH